MCHKLCAVIHDALDCRKCNTRRRPRRFLLTTPIHREWTLTAVGMDISPLVIPPDISLTLACDGMRQEVQMLCVRSRTNN